MDPSALSPDASKSHATRLRPSPPGRTKRHSLTPTSRSNIATAAMHSPIGGKPLAGPKAQIINGVRERLEEDISRAGRGELEAVLREEWDARDKVLKRMEEMEAEQQRLEVERGELVQSLGGMQSRVDEAFHEQGRLEADLEGRDQLLERLRGHIADTEKSLRDAQKRYTEQEKSFESERDAYRAQETHLQSRIHTLSSKSKASGSSSADETETLHEELASLSAAHCSLVAQLNTVSKELQDVKEDNRRLEEENAGWELLLRERTMSGQVRGHGLFSEDWLDEGEDVGEGEFEMHVEAPSPKQSRRMQRGRSALEALDEEMEADMETLEEAQMPQSGSGGDLAAELSRVGSAIKTAPATTEASEALRAEVKALKDANKALSLYCSKILDRIIAQEGFEHILATDYKTRRAAASNANSATRPSVLDVMASMRADSPVEKTAVPVLSPPQIRTPEEQSEPQAATEKKKARPLSMMVRGWSSSGEKDIPRQPSPDKPTFAAPPVIKAAEEIKDEKRAKRGFSIDFRSFGFGSAAPPPPPASHKGLKPLTLPQRAASQSSVLSQTPSVSPGALSPAESQTCTRKLAPTEEDEEDLRERHRMEATMKLMGIDRSSVSPVDMDDGRPTLSRGSSSSASASSPRMHGTPLSRLSSALGHASRSPTIELQDPMQPINDNSALAALKAFDAREAEQARALAKGTAQTEYTTPRPLSERRRVGGRRSSGSPEKMHGHGYGHGGMRVVSKSESISTLFSAGSDSRPNSVDLGK